MLHALSNPPRALRSQPSPSTGTGLRSYGLAVVTTLAAMGVTRFTWPVFAGAPFAPLFAAVAATTHWGGGPAGAGPKTPSGPGAPPALPGLGSVPPDAVHPLRVDSVRPIRQLLT